MKKRKIKLPYITPDLALDSNVVIIGSSPSLLGLEKGLFVDSFDEVIRFNKAKVKGYEKDIGSKTTVRVCNNWTFAHKKNNYKTSEQNTNFLFTISKEEKLLYRGKEDLSANKQDFSRGISRLKDREVYRTFPGEDQLIKPLIGWDIKLQDKRLTAGMVLISMCVLSDIKPTILGFDLIEGPFTHYYEKSFCLNHPIHDTKEERRILNNWIKEGKVIYG